MLLRRDRAMTAVAVMLDIAFHAGRGVANAAEIAERLQQARRGIEPVLQSLVRAGLLDSVRGPHGGYRLARPRKELGLAEIAAAVTEPATDAAVSGLQATVVQPLWDELDALCRVQLAGFTIDDLVKRAVATGRQRPTPGPVTFAI